MIIGRGGENVKSMSRESGAKIEVSRDDGDRDAEARLLVGSLLAQQFCVPCPVLDCFLLPAEDRNVTITGTAESIEKAMKLIEDVIGNRAGGLDDRTDACCSICPNH